MGGEELVPEQDSGKHIPYEFRYLGVPHNPVYLFSSSIPPTPPEGSECLLGCCLFPGLLIAEFLTKDTISPETTKVEREKGYKRNEIFLDFGIGIIRTGLKAWYPPDQPFPIDPSLGFDAMYSFRTIYAYKVTTGFEVLFETGIIGNKIYNLQGNLEQFNRSNWDIWGIPIGVLFQIKNWASVGCEYILSYVSDCEEIGLYDDAPPNTWITVNTRGRGYGFLVSANILKRRIPKGINISLRIANTNEYTNDADNNYAWKSVKMGFSGIYITYPLGWSF